MRTESLYIASLAAGLLLGLPRPMAGQSYSFTKILDGTTQRPDGLGRFYIGLGTQTPSFDGRWVVFRDPGPQNDDGSHAAIWSFDTRDSTFHKLVDWNTPVPGSFARFHDVQLMIAAPIVRNGIVVFICRDTTARQGMYSMPAGGGTITKIVDADTPDPTGGTFTIFDSSGKPVGAFSFDGSTVAFNASGSLLIPGNYSVKPDGTLLDVVADSPSMGGRIIAYYTPSISGNNVVLLGTDGVTLTNGYNGLYLGTPGGKSAVTELVNSTQNLPGNTNANFHTRIDWPVVGFEGSLVAFHATDSKSGTATNPAGLFGLYTTDLTSHVIGKIADVNSTLPGLGKLTSIAASGVSVHQGSVLFQAADNTFASALYIWNNGTAGRAVGKGDLLGGRTLQSVREPGSSALFGSSFAFIADFGPDQSLYLATPSPSTVTLTSVTNAASYGTSSIAPGEIVALFGTGLGPAVLAYGQFDANNQLPTQVSGARVLINGTPAPLIYVSATTSAAILPFGLINGSSAQVVVEYNGGRSNPVTVPVTSTMPGIFSADTSGSGQGAIQYADASYNSARKPATAGTVIVLWLTGLGPLIPTPTDGAIIPAGSLPTLQYPVNVSIRGRPAEIQYQGPGPLSVAGLYQINCVIPPGTEPGPADVVVSGDGRLSQANLTVAVQ